MTVDSVATATPAKNESSTDNQDKQSGKSESGGGSLGVYKANEGYATRLGLMVLGMCFVVFGCYHWYYFWTQLRDFVGVLGLGFLVNWTNTTAISNVVQWGGTLGVAAAGFAVNYYYIYINKRSAEFLVKTDMELGKVTWPKITPWFKADTQVWGETYVVLIVIALMTIYVFAVDSVLHLVAQFLFYAKAPFG